MSVLNVLLGIVPCTSCIGHENGQELGGKNCPGQERAQGHFVEYQAYDYGCEHAKKRQADKLLLRCSGADLDRCSVIGFGLALPQTLDLPELAPYFDDYQACSPPHGPYAHRTEQEGDGTAY